MKRLVGLHSKQKAEENRARNDLNNIVETTDKKAANYDSKVAQCDTELAKISKQLKSTRPGSSARLSLQEKARNILARKKRYEEQAEQLRDKSFNMDSLAMTINTAHDTKAIADCMKTGTKELKKELKKINLDKIEQVQDDMSDLIELSQDVEQAIARNYNVPENIDDQELNDQLELLGDEIIADNDPSYIDEVLKSPRSRRDLSKNNTGNEPGPGPSAMALGVDEFGLPVLDLDASKSYS